MKQPSGIRQTPGRISLLIAAGSALGGLARVLTGELVALQGLPDELATLLVNLIGSFAVGWIYANSQAGGRLSHLDPAWLQFLMPGVCAGFTTFSIFSLETLLLVQAGMLTAAALNLGLTLPLCLLAVWIGDRMGRPEPH